MAVARLRTSRRRRLSWQAAAATIALAAIGGTALWSSLRYSEAHAAARTGEGSLRPRAQGEQQQEQQGKEDKSDQTHSNLAAWTEMTTVGSGGSGGSGGGGGSGSSGGSSSGSIGGQQAGEAKPAAATGADSGAGYVTVNLRVPKMPPTFNEWVLAEDMLLFHRRALQEQLEQVYIGLALAAAAGRGFILPQLSCFCHQADAALPRCRRPGGEAAKFPEPCVEADVLAPLPDFAASPEQRGTPLRVEPHAAAAGIGEADTIMLQPSATILWPRCLNPKEGWPGDPPEDQRVCNREGRAPGVATVAIVPPSLNDTHLLPFLKPYHKYKLWRLDFSDIGNVWHAFQGWDCADPAHKFDQRMKGLVRPWPAPAGGGTLPLQWTSGRIYSDEPDMKQCPAGTNAAATAAARRLQRQEARRWREEVLEDL